MTPPAELFASLVGALELKQLDGVLLAAEVRSRGIEAGLAPAGLDEAITLAAWAHRGARRRRRGDLPRTAYIEHPLRNAARALRWGVRREAIVLACILHDTVEDHALELASVLEPATAPTDEHAAREIVLAAYERAFGARTAALVRAMSNPLAEPDDSVDEGSRHERYRRHVAEVIADPEVAVCKLADLADNALSLRHTDEGDPRTSRLARKYAPLLPIFRARIAHADVRELIDPDAARELDQALTDGADDLRALGARD